MTKYYEFNVDEAPDLEKLVESKDFWRRMGTILTEESTPEDIEKLFNECEDEIIRKLILEHEKCPDHLKVMKEM
jgi:hypothetical protein